MIISKKKFERLVEEEVQKRLTAAEKEQYLGNRIDNLSKYVQETCDRLYLEMEKLKLRFLD